MVTKKVNKAEEIRQLMKSGIKKPSEIVTKLKAKGIDVAMSQVYDQVSKKRRKKKDKKAIALNGSPKPNKGSELLENAVVFVRSAGGMASARELLNKLAQITP